MRSRSNTANRHLTTGRIVLSTPGYARFKASGILTLFLVSAVIGAAALYYAARGTALLNFDQRMAEMQEELAQTRAELEAARMDLEISLVARAEMERRLSALNEQSKQLREELEFVRSAGGNTPAR